MPEPLLKIEHLGIEFHTRRGTLVAVDDISFDVLPGKVFGIVGESGGRQNPSRARRSLDCWSLLVELAQDGFF